MTFFSKTCGLALLFVCILLLGSGKAVAENGDKSCSWGFLENKGQWPEDALFRSAASGFLLKFQRDGVCFMTVRESESHEMEEEEDHEEHEEHEEEHEYYVWKMSFAGGNPGAQIKKGKVVAARTNYFFGQDSSKWLRAVPEYDELIYEQVWKGIDVRFFLEANGALKYEFLLAPGADHEQIRVAFEGLNGLEIKENGQLLLDHPWGPVTEDLPVAFTAADKNDVPVRFEKTSHHSYGFAIDGEVPTGEAWVIDPLVMYWSSFVDVTGSTTTNYSLDVGYDPSGSVFIAGRADQFFPATTGAFQTNLAGNIDAFVSRFSPDGTNLMATTYLGGLSIGEEVVRALAVTDNGRVYVCGKTISQSFPTTSGSLYPNAQIGDKPFISCLDYSLSNMIFSTFGCNNCLGQATALAIAANGDAIVTGTTESSQPFVATPGALMTTHPGVQAIFLMRLSANGANMMWGTHFGSPDFDEVFDIALNALDEPYIVGRTASTNFPTTPGAFSTLAVNGGYVARLNATGSGLVYSSRFGGTNGQLMAVAVNPVTQEAYVTGTEPNPGMATTPGAFQTTYGGFGDATVARINASGTALIFNTWLGGSGNDLGQGIALNSAGEVYVSGVTYSPNFPVDCPNVSSYTAQSDAFLVHLSPMGDALADGGGSYFGGTLDEYYRPRIKVRDDGPVDTIFCTLTTHSSNFPTTSNAFQPTKMNVGDSPVAFKLYHVYSNTEDSSHCSLDSIPLSIPSYGTNPVWSTNETTPSIWATQTGQYLATYEVYNCTITDTFDISIGPPPVNLGPDTTFCANVGINLTLNAGAGNSWLWSTLDTTGSIVVTSPGTYSVTAFDTITGCSATDQIDVVLAPMPQVNLAPPPLCPGENILLNADPNNTYPGASYLWSNGLTTQQSAYNAPGWIWVDLTTAAGCTVRDSIFVVQSPQPSLDLGPDTTLCTAPSLNIAADPAFSDYLWSDNSTGPSATFGQSGWIWLQVTDTNGCRTRDSLLLTLGTAPAPDLGPDLILCEGDSVTLVPVSSTAGYSFTWSNGSSATVLSTGQSGDYWVEITETSSGCSARDSVSVAVFPFPQAELPADTLVCDLDSLLLYPGNFGSYLWSDGSTLPALEVTTDGTYSVTVSNGSCTDSASSNVVFGTSPVTDLGPDQELCLTDPRILYLSPQTGVSVLWSDGSTGWSMNFIDAGAYWAELTNECGTTRDSIEVSFAQELIEPFIPNVFTPNDDGISDCFRVENPDVQSFLLQIFDRWGRLMYETTNINDCWNGLYRNRPAPEGAYACIVRLRACNGELVTKSEMVTLVR